MNRRATMMLDAVVWGVATTVLAWGLARSANAASDLPAAAYAIECGSCHVAYPAKFLSPADWSDVLARLDRHYGVDASLDDKALAALATHLRASPGPTGRTVGARPLPRITTSRWFLGEHDELAAGTWSLPAVHGAANCAACHPGADRGNFDEHQIRLPRGIDRTARSEDEHEHDD